MRDFAVHLKTDLQRIREMMARDAAARDAAIRHMIDHHHRNVLECTAIHREHHRDPSRHISRIQAGRAFRGR
jgi:hypothetical protein